MKLLKAGDRYSTQIAKMIIDPKSVELIAGVVVIFLFNMVIAVNETCSVGRGAIFSFLRVLSLT